MKTTATIWIISAGAALMLYAGGYFAVVHKRPKNPFLGWPYRRATPMVEYYTVPGLKVIYDPAVQLGKWLFPRRWVQPRTSDEEIDNYFKNLDVNKLFEMSNRTNEHK